MKWIDTLKSKKGMTYPMTIALFIALIMLLTVILFLINAKLILREATKNIQVALDSYAVQRAIDAGAATPSGSGNIFDQIKNQDNTSEHSSSETVHNFIHLDDTMIAMDKFMNVTTGHFGYTRSGSILTAYKDPAHTKVHYTIRIDQLLTTGNPYELKVTFRVEVPYNSIWSKKMDAYCISNLNWKDEGLFGTGS